MNVPKTLAIIILYVKILQALIDARNVKLVTGLMDCDVLILMNVILVLISVIKMLDVKIGKELIAVNAIMVTEEMERLVMTLMNV